MKKIAMLTAMIFMALGAKAQDCDAIMLPYFGGNVDRMVTYREMAEEKFNIRCAYARAAFYESDTVPEGMQVFSITKVQEKVSGNYLPEDFVVDLNTLSYYAYTFGSFQVRNNSLEESVCFSTPGSRHPYLVLRSLLEMQHAADRYSMEHNQNR